MAVKFRQRTTIDAGPLIGIQIAKEFGVNDVTEFTDYNESLQTRVNIDQFAQLTVGFNSIDLAQCLVLRTTQPVNLYMTNEMGLTSQPIRVAKDRLSVFHCQLRGLVIENVGTAPLQGVLYLLGD
jgi:hypothetical protein